MREGGIDGERGEVGRVEEERTGRGTGERKGVEDGEGEGGARL